MKTVDTLRLRESDKSGFSIDSSCDRSDDVTIAIFSESLNDYVAKLNRAAQGRYELDDYDMQVIAVAMEQFASQLQGRMGGLYNGI